MVRFYILFIILATTVLISGCATQKGHRVLTLFFDGVPERSATGSPKLADSLVLSEMEYADTLSGQILEPATIVHFPYQVNECYSCHDANAVGNLLEPEPELCYQCHEDFNIAYEYLHGPVAGGYCTSCHDPHRSKTNKLLKRSGQELCNFCHNQNSSFNYELHEGLEEMSCTECHNPHGGSDGSLMH